jgi:acyl dehydratase
VQVIESISALPDWVGRELAPSDWLTVTQAMINAFAEVTGDRQWIHVDLERAKREMPGGRTIAHGYLTLSLLARLQPMVFRVQGISRGINYGANRLRFINPVQVDSRIRLRQVIKSVEPVPGGVRLLSDATIEIENEAKPALVVESVALLFA